MLRLQIAGPPLAWRGTGGGLFLGEPQLHLDLPAVQTRGSSPCSPRWGGGAGSALLHGAPYPGVSGALCHTDSCLSCGRRNPATFHPLFEGGLCQTCRVSAAVPGPSGSLGPEDGEQSPAGLGQEG